MSQNRAFPSRTAAGRSWTKVDIWEDSGNTTPLSDPIPKLLARIRIATGSGSSAKEKDPANRNSTAARIGAARLQEGVSFAIGNLLLSVDGVGDGRDRVERRGRADVARHHLDLPVTCGRGPRPGIRRPVRLGNAECRVSAPPAEELVFVGAGSAAGRRGEGDGRAGRLRARRARG